jgi:hypothetical protein
METDKSLIFEVHTNQKVFQYWTYKVSVKPGTNLPKDYEEWADILYNGKEGFEVSDPIHDTDYDSMMEEIITNVTIPLGKA